jgi:hypothetical protein
MKQFFFAVGAGLVAVLVGVAKYFGSKAERLEAANHERDAKEREEVARIEERRDAVMREHLERKPVDPRNRTDFE